MSLAQEIDQFFQETGQSVFIEAEGKISDIRNFISNYNENYTPSLSVGDEGLICLDDSKNKWAIELRCYFDVIDGFPDPSIVARNRVYRPDYSFRFNSNSLIKELFELGYRIGLN